MILKKYTPFLLGTVSLALLFLCLLFSSTASDSAKNGIYLCLNTVVPSLFPILVINGLLVSSGTAKKIANFFSFPIRKIFGVDRSGVYPVMIGLICGAPSGCIALSSVTEDKKLSPEEAAVIAVISSPVSFSFLYTAVGRKMLGERRLGIILYCICIISSALAGRILSLFFKINATKNQRSPSFSNFDDKKASLSQIISSSASSMISVCGSIVFFSAISGIICSIPKLPINISASASMLFEISSGANTVTGYMPPETAFLYLCVGMGWSGLSIICQCLSTLEKKVGIGLFLLGKIICSAICLLLGFFAVVLGLI